MKLSHLAETLIGSEIIKLAAEIKEKIRQGEKIYNFTIGDFDPNIFPIPADLEEEIHRAYRNKFTSYPPADGILELRQAVARFMEEREGLDYDPAREILISCGGRPLIYAVYRTLVDRGERIIYAVPSWNNNHYTHFVEGEHIVIEATVENNFMPTAQDLRPVIQGAVLLALCSPQNPTGTAFSKNQLEDICDLVLEENNRRGPLEKKLIVLFDQMYWILCFGKTQHFNPVSLRPAMKPYTVFVDGMSKAFCSTGVRVGWALGPVEAISKMKGILGHIGAWSPMAEQHASAQFLVQRKKVDQFLIPYKKEVQLRLEKIYEGITQLKEEGHQVDCIVPQAAIYLTIQMDLKGKRTSAGQLLENQEEVTRYLLDEAGLAIVPFHAFGGSRESPWYRLSVGTCKKEEIPQMLNRLKEALKKLH
ncbi:MAG: pyridoxal phosphate-dependent aminotransferase [Chitinophagaceae bacterium]